jgi:hypothetical protein
MGRMAGKSDQPPTAEAEVKPHSHHPGPAAESCGDQEPANPIRGGGRLTGYHLVGRALRFFAWWLLFAGIYGSSAVCPFCGRVGCPVGGASAGVVGAFCAVLVQPAAGFFRSVRRGLKALRSWLTAVPPKP